MESSESAAGHRCPRCGGAKIERRSPRGALEHSYLALTRRAAYRCVECTSRFYQRPTGRAREHRRSRPAAVAAAPAVPVATGDAPTSGATPGHRPRVRRRREIWRLDFSASGTLGRREIYLWAVVGWALLFGLLLVLWALWPGFHRPVIQPPD